MTTTTTGRTPVPLPSTAEPHRAAGLRVGFLSHLDHTDDLSVVYRENLELIAELERQGWDSAWVATRHFHTGWANLPSPFAFFGAAAARTERITLGTAVLPIIVDDPVRVAEEVAVLDHLSGGRLQLGLGKGVPSDGYGVFQRWGADREGDYEAKVDQLHWALQGSAIPDSRSKVHPPNEGLRGRIYHGTSTLRTIRRAAELGDGFILERFGNGPLERTPQGRAVFLERQRQTILEYRSAFARQWGEARTPHVVLSRTAWPAASKREALAELGTAVEHWHALSRTNGRLPEGLTFEQELLADNISWGSPDDLVAELTADPSFLHGDELVLGLHPGTYTLPQAVEKARVLLTAVVPALERAWLAGRAQAAQQVADYAPNDATVGASR